MLPQCDPLELPIAKMFLQAAEEAFQLDIPVYPNISGFGMPNRVVPRPYAQLAKNTDWSWVASDKISKTVSGAKYGLYFENINELDPIPAGHEYYDRVEMPNPGQPWHEFLYDTMQGILVLGTIFHYKVLDQTKKPLWIYNMYSEYGDIKIERDVFGRIVKYILMSPNGQRDIPPDFMSHFRYFNINDSTYGKGPGQAMPHMVDLDVQIKKFASSFLKNGTSLSGWIKPAPDEPITEKQARQLRDQFEDRHAGESNVGKVGLLPPKYDFIESAMSPRDMQNAELFPIIRDQLAQTYGIPKSVMGISEATNRADAEAGIYVYYKFCIDPYLHWIEAYLNRTWLGLIDKRLVLKFDNIVPEDKEAQARLNQIYITSGQRTPDEIREQDDLKPYPNKIGSEPLIGQGHATLKSVVEDLNFNFTPIERPPDRKGTDVVGDTDDPLLAESVQDTALNGAQIVALVQIIEQVKNGIIPPDTAKSMILASFPTLDEKEVDDIIDPVVRSGILDPEDNDGGERDADD